MAQEPLLALAAGALFTCGFYLLLRRNLLRFIFGLILLSNGANLLILTAGRLTRAAPPIIAESATQPAAGVANALPQALILTAIVISFGLTAFALALLVGAYRALGSVDTDELASSSEAGGAASTADARSEAPPALAEKVPA